MHPHFYKDNPFPLRSNDLYDDDNPPMSLNEEIAYEENEERVRRDKSNLLNLLNLL